MVNPFRLAVLVPVFVASFLGNAVWDYTEKLIRRGDVVRNVGLRYDKITTKRLRQIRNMERQNATKRDTSDYVTILEFEGTPPRPITWLDVDGKSPEETLDHLRLTSGIKKLVPVIDFPPVPKRK
jgi:hypothetical protein